MEIKRGTPPSHVERSIQIEMSREEVLSILVTHVKRKLQNDRLHLDDIEVVGSPDAKLEAMTLTGAEVIPLNWNPPEKKADELQKAPA